MDEPPGRPDRPQAPSLWSLEVPSLQTTDAVDEAGPPECAQSLAALLWRHREVVATAVSLALAWGAAPAGLPVVPVLSGSDTSPSSLRARASVLIAVAFALQGVRHGLEDALTWPDEGGQQAQRGHRQGQRSAGNTSRASPGARLPVSRMPGQPKSVATSLVDHVLRQAASSDVDQPSHSGYAGAQASGPTDDSSASAVDAQPGRQPSPTLSNHVGMGPTDDASAVEGHGGKDEGDDPAYASSLATRAIADMDVAGAMDGDTYGDHDDGDGSGSNSRHSPPAFWGTSTLARLLCPCRRASSHGHGVVAYGHGPPTSSAGPARLSFPGPVGPSPMTPSTVMAHGTPHGPHSPQRPQTSTSLVYLPPVIVEGRRVAGGWVDASELARAAAAGSPLAQYLAVASHGPYGPGCGAVVVRAGRLLASAFAPCTAVLVRTCGYFRSWMGFDSPHVWLTVPLTLLYGLALPFLVAGCTPAGWHATGAAALCTIACGGIGSLSHLRPELQAAAAGARHHTLLCTALLELEQCGAGQAGRAGGHGQGQDPTPLHAGQGKPDVAHGASPVASGSTVPSTTPPSKLPLLLYSNGRSYLLGLACAACLTVVIQVRALGLLGGSSPWHDMASGASIDDSTRTLVYRSLWPFAVSWGCWYIMSWLLPCVLDGVRHGARAAPPAIAAAVQTALAVVAHMCTCAALVCILAGGTPTESSWPLAHGTAQPGTTGPSVAESAALASVLLPLVKGLLGWAGWRAVVFAQDRLSVQQVAGPSVAAGGRFMDTAVGQPQDPALQAHVAALNHSLGPYFQAGGQGRRAVTPAPMQEPPSLDTYTHTCASSHGPDSTPHGHVAAMSSIQGPIGQRPPTSSMSPWPPHPSQLTMTIATACTIDLAFGLALAVALWWPAYDQAVGQGNGLPQSQPTRAWAVVIASTYALSSIVGHLLLMTLQALAVGRTVQVQAQAALDRHSRRILQAQEYGSAAGLYPLAPPVLVPDLPTAVYAGLGWVDPSPYVDTTAYRANRRGTAGQGHGTEAEGTPTHSLSTVPSSAAPPPSAMAPIPVLTVGNAAGTPYQGPQMMGQASHSAGMAGHTAGVAKDGGTPAAFAVPPAVRNAMRGDRAVAAGHRGSMAVARTPVVTRPAIDLPVPDTARGGRPAVHHVAQPGLTPAPTVVRGAGQGQALSRGDLASPAYRAGAAALAVLPRGPEPVDSATALKMATEAVTASATSAANALVAARKLLSTPARDLGLPEPEHVPEAQAAMAPPQVEVDAAAPVTPEHVTAASAPALMTPIAAGMATPARQLPLLVAVPDPTGKAPFLLVPALTTPAQAPRTGHASGSAVIPRQHQAQYQQQHEAEDYDSEASFGEEEDGGMAGGLGTSTLSASSAWTPGHMPARAPPVPPAPAPTPVPKRPGPGARANGGIAPDQRKGPRVLAPYGPGAMERVPADGGVPMNSTGDDVQHEEPAQVPGPASPTTALPALRVVQ